MSSIRSYLLVRWITGAAVTMLIAGATVFWVLSRSLEAQFDRNLDDALRGLASLLFQVEDGVQFEFSDQLMPEYSRADAPEYFELTLAGGEVLERSVSLSGAPLSEPIATDAGGRRWTAELPDGRSGRFAARWIEVHHVYPEEGPHRPTAARVHIAVARGRETLIAAERSAFLACAAVAAALTALLSVLTWFVVERGLAPARRLAASLDRVDLASLPPHLDLGPMPLELAPVAEKADALVRRVDAALQRERRTSADIAHELRTPVSELLALADVALRTAGDAVEVRRALAESRDIAWRMGAALSTLLELARLEMAGHALPLEPCDVAGVLAEVLRSLRVLERERGLRVDASTPPVAVTTTSPQALRVVVSNLVGNALQYSPQGSVVRIDLRDTAGSWRLSVENPAPDLAREDLDSLSEPFWRKDRARSDRAHAGLGLALSRTLANAARLELTFELERGVFRASLSGSEAQVA